MSKTFPRRLTVLVSAGATLAAVAASALPAQAAAIPGWRINATFAARAPGSAIFTSVAPVSAGDAWSAGVIARGNSLTPQIRHWNGRSWAAVRLPARVASAWTRAQPVQSIAGATSASNVWIFSGLEGTAYLRLNGTRWSVGHLPGANPATGKLLQISAVQVFGKSDVWALGATLNEGGQQPTETPYAAHFNGTKWTVTAVPGNSGIVAVSAASNASLWAVAGTPPPDLAGPFGGAPGKQTLLHWGPKGGWQQITQPVLPAGTDLSGVVFKSGQVVVGGSEPNARGGRSPLLVAWNGTAWSAVSAAGSSSTKWHLGGLAADGRGGFWVTGVEASGNAAKLWHVTGGKWTAVQPNFGKHLWILFQLATVPHTDSVWGAGAIKQGKSAVGMIAIAGPTPR